MTAQFPDQSVRMKIFFCPSPHDFIKNDSCQIKYRQSNSNKPDSTKYLFYDLLNLERMKYMTNGKMNKVKWKNDKDDGNVITSYSIHYTKLYDASILC